MLWRAVGSLEDTPIAVSVLVLVTVPLVALVTAWLRACYVVALAEGRYSIRAPRGRSAG